MKYLKWVCEMHRCWCAMLSSECSQGHAQSRNDNNERLCLCQNPSPCTMLTTLSLQLTSISPRYKLLPILFFLCIFPSSPIVQNSSISSCHIMLQCLFCFPVKINLIIWEMKYQVHNHHQMCFGFSFICSKRVLWVWICCKLKNGSLG